MLIGKKHKVEAENLNVILSKLTPRKNRETGEKYDEWVVIGYFATTKGALTELVRQGVRDTGLKDLKSVVTRIDELEKLIRGLPTASHVPIETFTGQSNRNG